MRCGAAGPSTGLINIHRGLRSEQPLAGPDILLTDLVYSRPLQVPRHATSLIAHAARSKKKRRVR